MYFGNRKVAGLFKALDSDYDDLPRNEAEDAFATAYLSKLKLYLSRIVG
jgi:hypothetical protein